MILVNLSPLFLRGKTRTILLVYEVTPVSIAAVPFFCKSMASLGLVRTIGLHIDTQLLRAMSELALSAIWTITFLSEIFAKGAFGFAGNKFWEGGKMGKKCCFWWVFTIISLCGGVWAGIIIGFCSDGISVKGVLEHEWGVINDYRQGFSGLPL